MDWTDKEQMKPLFEYASRQIKSKLDKEGVRHSMETTFTYDWEMILKDISFYRDTWNKLVRSGIASEDSTVKNYLVCISWKDDGKTTTHPFETLEQAVEYSDNFKGSEFCECKIVKVL